MNWLSKLRQKSDEIEAANNAFPAIEKIGENLTPNLRALRLAMTASDLLLSMGVSANSVVARALDITEAYCARPVHIDIAANLLMVSQLRGLEKEPLTLIRPVAMRDVNYMTSQAVQKLIFDIHKGGVSLEDAEARLDSIIQQPKTFPWWIIMMSNGLLVAGVSLMFTSTWQIILTTFIIGLLVDRLLYLLAKSAFPAFFRQVAAAAFVTITAAVLNVLAGTDITFFHGMNPTLIGVGGIIMLVAGLAVVGAIQDAIEEYYITANARMTKVFIQTIGIVIGIMVGLYTARKMGIGIAVSPDPLLLNSLQFQITGAAVAAIGYALSTQTNLRAIVWVGIIGGAATSIMYSSVHWFSISIVPASGIAAAFVGLTASFMSRFWRTPSVGIIAAGIVPLVPGLMLYNGLMQLINYPPGDPFFFKALGTLFTVGTTGLAIAAGASLGSMIGRPFRQKIAADRNLAPFINLLSRQFQPKGRYNLASFVLRRNVPRASTTIPAAPADNEPEKDNPYSA
jgi:uncharacterized membrane protein YjjP (DUF1212 family)